MKKINTAIIALVAASLILVAGCYDSAFSPDPIPGYDGFIAAGWAYFADAEYELAMENFQDAIDMDVTRPEGYLGAGWCSILLPDYWVIGDQYDYMAVQQDGGTWPVSFSTESQVQDINWTVFQCVDPVLTDNDMLVIGSWGTTDTLIVDSIVVFEPDSVKPAMDNYEIGEWLYDQYGAIDFKYVFEIDDPNVNTIFTVFNGSSLIDATVDSLVNGANSTMVYMTMPYNRVPVGADDYRTWCMYENVMTYEYASYSGAGGATSIANDGVAAYAILQHARGINGNLYEGVSALLGLADEAEYSFSHYDGLTSLKLKGMAAAMAYANTEFKFALAVCQSEGYALDISVEDPDFAVELMQVIEMMLGVPQ